MPSVVIRLPNNRNNPGTLRIFDSNGMAVTPAVPALGRAGSDVGPKQGYYDNLNLNPLKKYGHTPRGEYIVESIEPSGPNTKFPEKSYGRFGVIRLKAVSGEALAAQINGRTGILIHAGDPGNFNGLRATGGCIRVSNDDMRMLMTTIEILERIEGETAGSQCSIDTGIEVSVVPVDPIVNDPNIVDPPPPKDTIPRGGPPGHPVRLPARPPNTTRPGGGSTPADAGVGTGVGSGRGGSGEGTTRDVRPKPGKPEMPKPSTDNKNPANTTPHKDKPLVPPNKPTKPGRPDKPRPESRRERPIIP